MIFHYLYPGILATSHDLAQFDNCSRVAEFLKSFAEKRSLPPPGRFLVFARDLSLMRGGWVLVASVRPLTDTWKGVGLWD